MEQRRAGRSGLALSSLGLGTMTWGRETDADEAAAQLVAFHDAGGTLVDTAASYSDGLSEDILGQLLADVIPRDELVVATKAGLRRTEDGVRADSSRRALLADLDASLRRLMTDHVDLWQVHTPDAGTPIEETLAALDAAVTSGKVRYAGVSNFAGWRTAEAVTWQRAQPGRSPLVTNQVNYSLLERGVEREVVPACLAMGLGILAYSPLGGGVLTGKYRGGVPVDSREAAGYRNLAPFRRAELAGIVESVATAAEGLATSPLAVALAWVREQPAVTSAIVGVRTLGQLTAILAATSLTLPGEIREALDDVSAPLLGYPESFLQESR